MARNSESRSSGESSLEGPKQQEQVLRADKRKRQQLGAGNG